MGKKLIKRSNREARERFVFETEEERKTLEDARNYFQSANLLLNKGLDSNLSKKVLVLCFTLLRGQTIKWKNSFYFS